MHLSRSSYEKYCLDMFNSVSSVYSVVKRFF